MIVLRTEVFKEWLYDLRDDMAKRKIMVCIKRLENGNFGDHHSVANGVSELRIHYGSGYRIYYTIRGNEVILLLIGGDKNSQKQDIDLAKALAKEV